ncbi:MAG: leucyl/phenylalanyl-tRNA--protein transferase [Sphingobacteriales bacterium]|nr:leucyl/phenylalanyl-tRNA--protein transferase [Sphingobacteriales bacterium]
MPLFFPDKKIQFPPVHLAEPDGLLAMGGDLSAERLLEAYRQGIFPWYEEPPILWWCPDPRFVLFPEDLKIAKTIKPLLRREEFEFTTNKAFGRVIHACRTTKRPGQHGTWITPEVERAYTNLHQLGYAHSAEVWKDGELAGGLYGIRIGKVFFGESMFSRLSNASRYAFIRYAQQLKQEGVQLIDCQVYTDYLKSFGARMIPRKEFVQLVQNLVSR